MEDLFPESSGFPGSLNIANDNLVNDSKIALYETLFTPHPS